MKSYAGVALQDGANRERRAWRKELKRLTKLIADYDSDDVETPSANGVLLALFLFAARREKRTRARKGGL